MRCHECILTQCSHRSVEKCILKMYCVKKKVFKSKKCILTGVLKYVEDSGQTLLKKHFLFFHWHFYFISTPLLETLQEAILQVYILTIDPYPK